ncbi:TonB-dependent receptor [Salinisphaera sp. G21_0]|uniref:TonB-dependent receptor domain-containing protein n=1 Tax=Salinisphaera sp. G21_0 TaxID=2821094 RepID=UPI001ADC32E0|nr:TonB-dependent receptor [Salinisphaera sp. G21_0]MBO9481128.1 TonB-dependent receptor [Salinisphaera sp. G21_0]
MSFNHRSIFARTGLSVAVVMSVMSSAAAAEELYKLVEVVVTAARTAQTVDETLAPVTVISREQIERSQAKSVTEVLRTTPGLQVTESGGQGSLTSIFLRGTNSNHTLVLVDGVRINDATGGMPSIPYLNPDQIERIEIVRGPKSSLYGADAIGGVIQIFTRRGSGDPRLTVKVGGGSRKTSNADLNYGGKVENTSFNVNTSFFETQGFDRSVSADADDDAYRNKSASVNVRHSFKNNSEAGFSIVHNQGKSEYDTSNDSEAFTEFSNTIYQLNYRFPVNDVWDARLEAGYSVDDNANLAKKVNTGIISNTSKFKTNRKTLAWVNDVAWNDTQLLTIGADYYKDDVDDGKAYIKPDSGKNITTRSNKAVFVQNQSDLGWSDLVVGLRTDDNDAYGAHTTGNIAWGIPLPNAMKVIASYGTAYRAPTMYQLYAPESVYDGVTYKSNPNLRPEKSESYELELKGNMRNFYWSVSIFENNIDDLITGEQIGNVSMQKNVAKARIRGLELVMGGNFSGWDIASNLTFLDPKDLSTGDILLKRARQELNIGLDRQIGQFSLGGELRARSKTMHYGTPAVPAPGYGVFDLRASMQVAPEIKTEVKLVNAFDKDYQTTLGYNPEPRGVFASVIWSPEL